VAVYFLGDISAHFNPVTTLAFALRRDRGWVMALVCWIVQFGRGRVRFAAGQRAEAQRAVRPAGRRRLHHGLGHHGRPVRRCLDEPGPELRS
jgi:hypothetical protein